MRDHRPAGGAEDGTRGQDDLLRRAHEARLQQAGQMLAGIMHEINNPLAVVQGYSQLLLERADDERDRNDLQRILDETRRLGRLVQDMLNFTRNGCEVSSTVDLCEVVASALNLATHMMKQGGIAAVAALPPGPIWVRGSTNVYVHVLLNLLRNARDSLVEDGTPAPGVTLRTEPGADGRVQLTVSNNGPAIPAEHRETIFEPFFTTKREGEGTGLGLSLCREILARHDARIELDRPTGERGVCFRIDLPESRP